MRVGKYSMPMLLVSTDKASEDQVTAALKSGYRGLDCSPSFGNQEAIGKCIAASSVPREELFIISKVRTVARGVIRQSACLWHASWILGLWFNLGVP